MYTQRIILWSKFDDLKFAVENQAVQMHMIWERQGGNTINYTTFKQNQLLLTIP